MHILVKAKGHYVDLPILIPPTCAQVNAIETANLNAETMIAMKKGAEALKGIHGNMYVSSLPPQSRLLISLELPFYVTGHCVTGKSTRLTPLWTKSGNRWRLATRFRMLFQTLSTWVLMWTM